MSMGPRPPPRAASPYAEPRNRPPPPRAVFSPLVALLRFAGLVQALLVLGGSLTAVTAAATGTPYSAPLAVLLVALVLQALRLVATWPRRPPAPRPEPRPAEDPFAWKTPPDPRKVPARIAAATAREKGFVALVTAAPGIHGGGWLFLRRPNHPADTERLPLEFDEASHEFVVSVVEFYVALNRLIARGEFHR